MTGRCCGCLSYLMCRLLWSGLVTGLAQELNFLKRSDLDAAKEYDGLLLKIFFGFVKSYLYKS